MAWSRTDDAKKCPRPYHKTGKLRIWSGLELSGMGMKSRPEFPDSVRGKYLDTLVADDINALRDCLTCAHDPDDPLDYYQLEDEDFLPVLLSRVGAAARRDLTYILTLEPYSRGITDGQARFYIRALKPFQNNLVWEPRNEPIDNERQRQLVEILLNEGVPKSNLLIDYADCGDWFTMFDDFDLKGKVLTSDHWMGSVETLKEMFSGGTAQTVLSWGGFVGSCDGPDKLNMARGRNFYWCDINHWENRRPTVAQAKEIMAWLLDHGAAGWEFLSAVMFQRGLVPIMTDAFCEEARNERRALIQ